MPLRRHADNLETLYGQLNRRDYVEPDPLQFVYGYAAAADRETVALVAACLAYGRVAQILRSVADALARMGSSPGEFLTGTTPRQKTHAMAGFRHRFSDGANLAGLLTGAAKMVRRHGSLRACFVDGIRTRDETLMPAVQRFAQNLRDAANAPPGHLVADPGKGSACKRFHLMLRWLVRKDAVDPGGWQDVPADKLIVPLDTHMHRIATALGATTRRAADGRTAMEVTAAFRSARPDDPVRYDFSLTRLGIRSEMNVESFLTRCRHASRDIPHA